MQIVQHDETRFQIIDFGNRLLGIRLLSLYVTTKHTAGTGWKIYMVRFMGFSLGVSWPQPTKRVKSPASAE